MIIAAEQLQRIIPAAGKRALAFVVPLNEAMKRFAIDTPDRAAAFLAEFAHETQSLTRLEENLNYSPAGLMATFPSHFDAMNAARYAHSPSAIANHAYANREGNGDEASGDGWQYRGRGGFQTTFKNNYRACGDALGVNLVESPSLLAEPHLAALSAGFYWDSRKLNVLADRGDFRGVTRAIAGALTNYEDRNGFFVRAAIVLSGAKGK